MDKIIEIQQAVHFYNCIGSWWSYEDRIPEEIKRYLAHRHNTTIEDINKIAKDYVDPMYSESKPRPSDVDYVKNWG